MAWLLPAPGKFRWQSRTAELLNLRTCQASFGMRSRPRWGFVSTDAMKARARPGGVRHERVAALPPIRCGAEEDERGQGDGRAGGSYLKHACIGAFRRGERQGRRPMAVAGFTSREVADRAGNGRRRRSWPAGLWATKVAGRGPVSLRMGSGFGKLDGRCTCRHGKGRTGDQLVSIPVRTKYRSTSL